MTDDRRPGPPRRSSGPARAGSVRLGAGAEFDLIRQFIGEGSKLPPEVHVGPGDDAAVLEGGWVVTSDLSVEDVHFDRDWISDEEVGYRATAAAVSDLAAMGAEPIAILLSIAAPVGEVDLAAVNAGARALTGAFGAAVVGGDLTRSPGPLVVDVTALGRAAWPVRRDGAEPGDQLWVTGSLGGSAAAVRLRREGARPSATLHEAFARPRPRVREACALVEHEIVRAMIDLSDGLAGDAGHLAAASGVRMTIEVGRIPVSAAVREVFDAETSLELALHGGEDYELCFVTGSDVDDLDALGHELGIELSRVGSVSEGAGVWLDPGDGAPRATERGGFDHWGGR